MGLSSLVPLLSNRLFVGLSALVLLFLLLMGLSSFILLLCNLFFVALIQKDSSFSKVGINSWSIMATPTNRNPYVEKKRRLIFIRQCLFITSAKNSSPMTWWCDNWERRTVNTGEEMRQKY